MPLPFLDREAERERIRAALDRKTSSLICLWGRRRCGKTRLLLEALPGRSFVYHLADQREEDIQRAAVAKSIADLLPGFDRVTYPDWDALLNRWYGDAPAGAVLALDELPYLVQSSAALPSILQRYVDRDHGRPIHLILCGSSQRMMHSLTLDASAPLYGRAVELLRIAPLPIRWVGVALGRSDPQEALEAFSVWGGIPRYWELAEERKSLWDAVEHHVLDPLGVLHQEPSRMLLDDIRDPAQSASILALIGAGCHRLSEMAGRIGRPATALTRPLRRLEDLGLIRREQPFGAATKAGKKTLYRIDDPFLGFWYRFVEPHRSALALRSIATVSKQIQRDFPQHVAGIWEALSRDAVPSLNTEGTSWRVATRWWGPGTDRRPLEVDVVAESMDGASLLIGEVKLSLAPDEIPRALAELEAKVARLPFAGNYSRVVQRLFVVSNPSGAESVVTAAQVIAALG